MKLTRRERSLVDKVLTLEKPGREVHASFWKAETICHWSASLVEAVSSRFSERSCLLKREEGGWCMPLIPAEAGHFLLVWGQLDLHSLIVPGHPGLYGKTMSQKINKTTGVEQVGEGTLCWPINTTWFVYAHTGTCMCRHAYTTHNVFMLLCHEKSLYPLLEDSMPII